MSKKRPTVKEMKNSKIDREKLQEALAFARSEGLLTITVDGIKMDVTYPEGIKPAPAEAKIEDIFKMGEEELTDDEVLYWSTPYYDELQAQKEEKAKAKKETSEVRE